MHKKNNNSLGTQMLSLESYDSKSINFESENGYEPKGTRKHSRVSSINLR